MENQDNNNGKIAGYLFVGCMFIGMGVDAAMEYSGFGMFIGMGIGFIVSAVYRSEKSKVQ